MAYREWEKERFKSLPRLKTIDLSVARDGTEAIYIEGDRFFILRNDASDLQIAFNEPVNFISVPRIREGRGKLLYTGYLWRIFLKHSAIPNGTLKILCGFPEGICDFEVSSEDVSISEFSNLVLRKVWLSKEDLMSVHVVSGSPELSIVDVDSSVYYNDKALKIIIPPNSTVELLFGPINVSLNEYIYGCVFNEIPSDVRHRTGFARVLNENITKVWYLYSQPYDADVYGYGSLCVTRFLTYVDIVCTHVGIYIKLINENSTKRAVLIPIVIFGQQVNKPYYALDHRFTIPVTETAETEKILYYDYIARGEKLDYSFLGLTVYYKSDGVNTMTVNIYYNNVLVATLSTTSSLEQTAHVYFKTAYKKLTDIIPIKVKAYMTGGTGYITGFIVRRFTCSRELMKLNKFASMTFTGTPNSTTTHDILARTIKHYNVRKIVVTSDANASAVHLRDGIANVQISESIGASTTLTLDGGGGYIYKDIEHLQLCMTSGATAGVVTVQIYYDEIPALVV